MLISEVLANVELHGLNVVQAHGFSAGNTMPVLL